MDQSDGPAVEPPRITPTSNRNRPEEPKAALWLQRIPGRCASRGGDRRHGGRPSRNRYEGLLAVDRRDVPGDGGVDQVHPARGVVAAVVVRARTVGLRTRDVVADLLDREDGLAVHAVDARRRRRIGRRRIAGARSNQALVLVALTLVVALDDAR